MQSKGKKAVLNTAGSLINEVVAVICGIILPRLILETYGSTYNGLTSSITQFLSVVVLMSAGIGGATRAALYKPLAENDTQRINAIMSATNRFMKKVASLLIVILLIFSCLYPLMVSDQFDWIFVFCLFLAIALGKVIETMFGISYSLFLQADQKLYIISVSRIIVNICSTIVAALLIKMKFNIIAVKLSSSLVFMCSPLFLWYYVHSRYQVDIHEKPDERLISQRWDAFWHQIANFVMNNTDMVVLTAFSALTEVSVYAVYNLVVTGLRNLVLCFTNGLEAAFGNMLVTEKRDTVRSNFRVTEYIIFIIATLIYPVVWYLILPFVSIYTKGIHDVDYIRPLFADVIIFAQFFNCIRQPYQLMVQAAGKYRETKKGAIEEAVLNIVLSIVLVNYLGLIGVAAGTLAATIFRTIQYVLFVDRHILPETGKSFVKHMIIAAISFAMVIMSTQIVPFDPGASVVQWCLAAITVESIAVAVSSIVSVLIYRTEAKALLIRLNSFARR